MSLVARYALAVERVRTSFWALPGAFAIGALGLAAGARAADAAFFRGEAPAWLYRGSAEGARPMAEAIGGAAITVVSVTFSIMMVALAFASSQLGPRVLRNFIRDRTNQAALGGFLAVHLYCMASLPAMTGVGPAPPLTMTLALVLGAGGAMLLIVFVHHVATRIQADHVIHEIAAELDGHASALVADVAPGRGAQAGSARHELPEPAAPIPSAESGYVLAIDYDALLALAEDHRLVAQCLRRAGDFVMAGEDLARLHGMDVPSREVVLAVRAAHAFGPQRTGAQDLQFGVRQLVEVALRGLSPAMNDPFTAQTCIDHLGALLARLGARWLPAPVRAGRDGSPRLVVRELRFEELLDEAFDPLRQHGCAHLSVALRLLETLGRIGSLALPEHRDAILAHLRRVAAAAARQADDEEDAARLATTEAAALAAVRAPTLGGPGEAVL